MQLAFAELKGHVRDRPGAYGLADRCNDDRFFPTLGTTVRAYLAATGVDWSDWEDDASNRTWTRSISTAAGMPRSIAAASSARISRVVERQRLVDD